ncbi:hypothetical protein CDES_05180 [Corynebacterium deserti GIMN1.010]|uniref:MmcQ-like protein n=1 Tax=Corynebacterium deserti GIMN1.010 TaxID=931089 RepID=A0A0M3Q9E3_9CORY|nr:MmcQ/YjbR family DNA-binding protein [Corynebacterium deserti]ALC05473.1 hypothetical protein CDES_05180 [Corynebacterium deserti GIMN1.010]
MDLHHVGREHALSLVQATKEYPFGPETEVFKIRGKMFLYISMHEGEPIITLKADPEIGASLRSSFPSITPGYHMNKIHWISIRNGERITEDLVVGLVETSYHLVVSSLPKSKRP